MLVAASRAGAPRLRLRSSILTIAWRLLRALPPMAAWRLLHSAPTPVLDLLARLAGRPPEPPGLETRIFGLPLPHPVGVAAGFDKDARLALVAASMGAGFHVVGSVLPRPSRGVEPKILARLPDGGTVNRLGLPSPGAERVAARLRRVRGRLAIPLAVSIAAHTPEGYAEAYRSLAGLADWVEVNISCPNVEGASFEDPEVASSICDHLKPTLKPALLKIPPTRDDNLLSAYLDLVRDCGFSGLVAGNTLRITYRGVNAGLGGPSLYPTTLYMVRRIREMAGGGLVVIGVGGVDTGLKALELLDAGANAVEVLSAIIHRGPLAPWLIAWETARLRQRAGR
jgi:dihydroorotate dehydrogenase